MNNYLNQLESETHKELKPEVFMVTPHYVIQSQLRKKSDILNRKDKYVSIQKIDSINNNMSITCYDNNRIVKIINDEHALFYEHTKDVLTIQSDLKTVLIRKFNENNLPTSDILETDYNIKSFSYKYEKIGDLYVLTKIRYQDIDKESLRKSEGEYTFMYRDNIGAFTITYNQFDYLNDTSFTGFIKIDKIGRLINIIHGTNEHTIYKFEMKYDKYDKYKPIMVSRYIDDVRTSHVLLAYKNGNCIKHVTHEYNNVSITCEKEFDTNNNILLINRVYGAYSIKQTFKIQYHANKKMIFEYMDDELRGMEIYELKKVEK